ncbi:unnamed protein product [Musa textilis]
MSSLSVKLSSFISIEPNKLSGWSDAQVMKLMQRDPRFLCAKVETVLKPRMRSLQDMGFSDTEIVQLVTSCPRVLLLRDIQPRINFWRSLLGSNERFLKACKTHMFLLTYSLAQKIEPSISLLRECGISDERIAHMVMTMPGCFGGIDKLKEVIKYIEESGVPRDSGQYTYALGAVMSMSRSRFDATSSILMKFGWSQPDIIALFRKCPSIWSQSKKSICDKMTFLMTEAGCELTYIVGRPVILTFSLEKRLRPRYEVLNFLKQNKLLDKEHGLLSVMLLSEEKFINKFLFRHKEKFTSLYDSYRAAVQGKEHVMRTASSNSHPCPKCNGEIISSSTAIATAAAFSSVDVLSLRQRHPQIRTRAPKFSGVTVSFSTATATAACTLAKGGSSGGIFLRRALIPAAFSSENGQCCGFPSVGER